MSWYTRKDKTFVYKEGRYKVLEIFKRPHGGYCCMVWNKGYVITSEGVFGTSLPNQYFAVRWGIKKAKELKLIK